MDELIEQLRAGDPEVRQMAAFNLGQTRDKKAIPHLVSVLDDSDLYARVYAIQALRDIPDKSSTLPLCNALKSSLDQPLIVSNVCRALGQIKDSESISTLLELLKNSDPFTRYDAAYALGEIGDPVAITALEAMFSDETMPEREDEDSDFVDTIYSVGEQAKRAVEMIKNQI